MDSYTTIWESLIRLAVAVGFGACMGWERESKDRPAGLRTHMLVALGAAGFTLVGMELAEAGSGEGVRLDPLRVIGGVVGGVGFLGAGAIIQSRGRIRGLTTAAGLWVVAAVGVAAGAGIYEAAGVLVALGLVTLAIVKPIEQRVFSRNADDAAPLDE